MLQLRLIGLQISLPNLMNKELRINFKLSETIFLVFSEKIEVKLFMAFKIITEIFEWTYKTSWFQRATNFFAKSNKF